jgi:hypothetical protein
LAGAGPHGFRQLGDSKAVWLGRKLNDRVNHVAVAGFVEIAMPANRLLPRVVGSGKPSKAPTSKKLI